MSKTDSTIGALTVPAKLPSDAPFTLTAPTSTISSIISAVNTITSTASVIVTPPDSRDISYGTTWTQRGQDIDGEATNDRSGYSVSMSADGTVLAIGAPFNAGTVANSQRGHVRIYAWNGSSWVQRGADIDGEATLDRSGTTVSLSANGNVVAIGAYLNDGTVSSSDRGHVRVYAWNGTSWVQRGQDIDGESTNDHFGGYDGTGLSISADGTIVAIGAHANDGTTGNVNDNRGHVRIYAWNGTTWTQRGQDIDGEETGDQSGQTVSISADGTVVAIGAPYNDVVGTTSNRGHVRIYAWNGSSWIQRGADIDGTEAGGNATYRRGLSISADGTIVAIGAAHNAGGGTYRGNTRIYVWNGTSWIQRGSDINGEANNDYSGYSVSLTSDGTIVAIGAYGNSQNGSYSGHVRIYAWNGSSWVQRGQDIDGEAANDYSGMATCISADGTIVAIGAEYNDGTVAGSDRGHVRVYQIATTNAFTYSSSDSSIADVCGNLLLIKGVNGTSTITATQTGNTVTGRLDVSGTTYTLQYNPMTYTSSNTSVATVSTYGTVTLTGTTGTSTITATQPETLTYASKSVTGSLVVSKTDSTLGALTVPAKVTSDAPFTLTAPTSTISSIISAVNTITSTASVIVTPPDSRDISYGTTWSQLGADILGTQSSENCGHSVSVSADGTVVAIASPYYDIATNANEGRTRIYKYNGTSWNQLGLDISGTQVDEYCDSVSLSADGTTVAIGATGYDNVEGLLNSGRVRIYKYNGTAWIQRGLDIPGNKYYELSGLSVSISSDGNIVAVGSYNYNNTDLGEGRARVYKYNETSWIQLGADILAIQRYEECGYSVSVSADGTTVAIGSRYYDNAGGTTDANTNEGRTRIFRYNGTSWIQLGLDILGNQANERSGWSVSISADGNTVAIGSSYYDIVASANEGRTRIFRYNGTSWNQLGLDISGNQAAEYSGWRVSISADGNTVAIGSHLYDVTGTNNEGRTRIFRYNGTSWIQLGLDILGNQVNELSGWGISISADGTTVAIGSFYYDKAGGTTDAHTNEGRVRVYQIATTNAFTYSSSDSSIADVCGNLLLIKGVNGTSTITATQTGNTVTGRLDVSGTTYTLQYNPMTYTSSNASVATVSTYGTVTLTGTTGTSTITATQPETLTYASKSTTGSLVVSLPAPTIGALTVPAKNFGDAAFNLTAPTSDSDGTFTYTSSNASVATVTSGGTVTIVGVGSTTITATQAATGNYTTGSVTASLVVSASLSNFNVPAKTYGDASFNLTDPDTTDNTVGFTFTSSNASVATLSGSGGRTVTIVGAGSSVITASQAATASRGQLDISATLVVSQAIPVITAAAITKSYGNASFRPVITSTNTDTSGSLVFTITSNNIAVVSMLDASLVRINGVGTATLSITQAASANFTDASSSVVVTVNKGVSGFSASSFVVPTNKTYGDAAFAITTAPISSSTGAITYTSSDEAVATVTSNGSGNAITVVGQGTVTFTASQAESALYTADTKTSNTLTVARKTAALSRDTPDADTISKAYGDANFSVTATNESNGAFSFSSSDPSFATIDASTGLVTIVAVGSTTLTATRAETAQYNAASVSWTLNIARGTTTLTGLSSLTRNITVAPFSVTASSASDGAVSYALQDPSSTVLTIHPTSGLITLLAPGSAVIVASQAQGTLHEAPSNITATITVTAAATTLQGATLTNTQSFANVDLSGASLANANITNTNFASGRLNNSNFNGATISSANMTSAGLSDATMRGATITGTDFTSAVLRRTDLSGANVRSSIFNSADLSGAILTRMDASGASFINADLRGANLSNADFTNANMTNANISGVDLTNVSFTVPQKLQLLKNQDNRPRGEIQVSQVAGSVLLPVLTAGSAVRDVPNVANATFKVMLPTTSLVSSDTIPNITLDISNFAYFYFPIGENEYFQIEDVKYYVSGSIVRNFATGAVVENTTYGVKAIRLLAGSISIIVNSQNTLSSSSFVVPSIKQNTDAPFSPTTLPTSNSSAPIVYTSSNTSVATINSSTGVITPVEDACGFVRFTASQVATETHESASITSNELFINKKVDLTLVGLNQTFSLSTLASLDASSIAVDTTDATAVFYIRLSDMTNLFQYQTDAFDVNNLDASDVKYYVFHRTMPADLHINPSHAMMNKTESAGMLGTGIQEISADKSLVKHDFIRYIALRLFNTHYGVDLFQNEQELQENITYLGETVQHNIDTILSGISTTSASQDMAYDATGNKYLTNDASGNTNLCRELMRQIAASEPSRFYNNGGDISGSGIRAVPLREDDSINFKLTITAAEHQNILTGVTVIPSRTYMIKMVLKNTVNASTNANTVVTDSDMYPNSYPYSTAVTTYTPSGESSASVYNVYSPPAPIPTARYGYNGWYYANSTTWVNVAPAVRDRVKWVLPPNAAGSSTVADLRYIRMNLKVFNKTSLAFLVVSTQAGSSRKYTISAPNSLTNGTVYSFYMNFHSYTREPATVGATNAALAYSNVGSGSFANGEVITSIAVETDSEAASGTVEFTLSSVVVGEASGEKEYGFSANV